MPPPLDSYGGGIVEIVRGRSNNRTTTGGSVGDDGGDDDDRRRYHDEKLLQLERMDRSVDPRDAAGNGNSNNGNNSDNYVDHYDEFDFGTLFGGGDHQDDESGCYPVEAAFASRPTCNDLHTLSLDRARGGTAASTEQQQQQSYDINFAGRGRYRDAYLLSPATTATTTTTTNAARRQPRRRGAAANNGGASSASPAEPEAALKVLRYGQRRRVSAFSLWQTRAEALAMLYTSSSHRTFDVYGHCGTSLLVESGRKIDFSRLSRRQKAEAALAMAESVAELHGNSKGVIVNADLSPDQWLTANSGRPVGGDNNNNDDNCDSMPQIKLNDFNFAKFLKWNPKTNEYCPFRGGSRSGVYRAPEEMLGGGSAAIGIDDSKRRQQQQQHWPVARIDESSDVNSFGKVLYHLLTGRTPYYHLRDNNKSGVSKEELKRAVSLHGALPVLPDGTEDEDGDDFEEEHPLAFVRAVMERCYSYKATDRPSIFDVVRYLRRHVDGTFTRTNDNNALV